MPFPNTSFDPFKRACGTFAVLEFQQAEYVLGKAVAVSSLKFSKYSARKKLINSSAGKPVSFEHHESVAAFSGVSLTVVFIGGRTNLWSIEMHDRQRA